MYDCSRMLLFGKKGQKQLQSKRKRSGNLIGQKRLYLLLRNIRVIVTSWWILVIRRRNAYKRCIEKLVKTFVVAVLVLDLSDFKSRRAQLVNVKPTER